LGGLAAALSSHFLSTACWGVAAQIICIAMAFLAIGLTSMNPAASNPITLWIKVILAGMAVGMCVMEGYDIGAIFSIYVAAFVFYQTIFTEPALGGEDHFGTLSFGRAAYAVARVGVVAVFAGFLAFHAISTLVGTQIKGVAGTEQTAEAREARWDFATQWSFPPGEILRIVVPGLFGYRMDTPEGGNYWGRVGETPGWSEHHNDPEWARTHPGAYPRFSGGGEYSGVLVFVVAVWAVLQAFRKKDSVFTLVQRRLIWFWAGAAFVSLLFAFGRYAPFYRIVYSLPYFSTIRNPAKFMHPFHWSLVILFAYGIHGLVRRYLEPAFGSANSLSAQLKTWWAKANPFDKKWTRGSIIALAISLLGWLMYSSSRSGLEKRLFDTGFPDSALTAQIASFSFKEVGWSILFLGLTVGLLTVILSGRFAGSRAKLGGVLLGLLLVLDLARANMPWIIYQDYKEKYATNPVIEFLRDKPYEHRAAILPFGGPAAQQIEQLYKIEWAQHHFQFFNIQSLDVVQMPRAPVDYLAFEGALRPDANPANIHRVTRRWELTNTRYLLGARGLTPDKREAMLEELNRQLDPTQRRFRITTTFDIVPKPGVLNPTRLEEVTAVARPEGQFALFEFTGALPRAKLYSNWQVNTNDQSTLDTIASVTFAPEKLVLVAPPFLPSPQAETNITTLAPVEFVSYAPKRIVLHAKASAPSVLLLNDKFDPNWKVWVDGKPDTVLRCNYLMRGVQVPAGDHQVEFRFVPPVTGLYVSLAAIVLGLGLIGFLVVGSPRHPPVPIAEPRPKAKQPEKVGAAH